MPKLPIRLLALYFAWPFISPSDAVSHSSYAWMDSHSDIHNEQVDGSDGHHRQQTTTYDSSQSTFDSYRSTQRIDGSSDTHYQGNRAQSGNGWRGQWQQRPFAESEVEHGSYHMPLSPQDDRPNAYDLTVDSSDAAMADTPAPCNHSTNPPVNTPPAVPTGPGGFSPQEDSQSISGLYGDVAMAGSTALLDHAARDAAFAELADETEPSDESPSATRIVSSYVDDQGTLPAQQIPEAIRIEMGNGEHIWIINPDHLTNPPIASDDGLCPCGCGMSMPSLPMPEDGPGDGAEGERGDYTPEQTLAIEMILAYQQASSRLAELKRLLERTGTNWFGVPTFAGTQEQRDAWLRERDELTELLGDLWETFRVEGLDSVPIDYHRLLGLPTPDEMSPHGSLMQLRGMGSRGMQNTGGILTHLRQMDDVYQMSRPLNHAIQSLDYDLALATSIGGAVPGGFRAIVGAVGLDAAEAASGLPVGFMTAVRPRFNRTLHVINPGNTGNLVTHAGPVAYGTPYRQMSKSRIELLQQRVADRSITRDEWKQLRWQERLTDRRVAGREAFWAQERQLLAQGLPGTRSWNASATQSILSGGQPRGIFSHHKYSVSQYPQLANDPANIVPLAFFEHFQKYHAGSWRNATHGAPLCPHLPDSF